MSQKHEKHLESVERNRRVELLCDLCGKEAPNPEDRHDPWAEELDPIAARHLASTAVSMKTGKVYHGDAGETEETSVDICPECFREQLIPWLKEQGAEPRVEEAWW